MSFTNPGTTVEMFVPVFWWRVGAVLTRTHRLAEGSFPAFAAKFRILFTSGLILSAVTDVYVSIARYWYLRDLKDGYVVYVQASDLNCPTCFKLICGLLLARARWLTLLLSSPSMTVCSLAW